MYFDEISDTGQQNSLAREEVCIQKFKNVESVVEGSLQELCQEQW